MEFRLSNQAAQDIKEIYKYSVGQFGELQAQRYDDSLWACFDLLAANPRAGRERLAFMKPLRSHQHQKHVIFYCIREDYILIVRVLHERMDPERHLELTIENAESLG